MNNVGTIATSAVFTESYQNHSDRADDDESSEYVLDGVEIFEENFGHGPLDISVLFANNDNSYNAYYEDNTFCDGTQMYFGYNDATTNKVHISGDGRYDFDECEPYQIGNTWYAKFSLSTQA